MTIEKVYASHSRMRAVRVLVTARAVNRLGAFTLPFLAVVLVQTHGATPGQAGQVVALFGLATIASRLAGGALADRVGRRRTMVGGLVGCAVSQLAVAGAPGLLLAAVAAAALGLCFELYEPPSQAMLSELVAPEDRTHAFGLLAAALAAAGLAAGLLAAVLGRVDLRLLLVADAVTCLACALTVALVLPEPVRRGRANPGAAPSSSGPVASPWRDVRLLAMLAAGTAFATLYLALVVALPLTLVARGMPAADAGWTMALSAAVIVLGQRVLRRRPAPRAFAAMAAGYVVLAGGLALLAVADTLLVLLVAAVVWSVGDLLLLSHPYAVVAGLATDANRAGYLAAYGVSWGLAGVIAPLGATALLAISPTLLWASAAALALLLASAQGPLSRVVD